VCISGSSQQVRSCTVAVSFARRGGSAQNASSKLSFKLSRAQTIRSEFDTTRCRP
jgi:hypothetical protein